MVDIWSLGILDLKGYDVEKNRGYRCVLIVIKNFSEFASTVPLKGEKAEI